MLLLQIMLLRHFQRCGHKPVVLVGGVLVLSDLCRHDQRWAYDACGDFWLGFDEADLVDWAGRAGLALRESLFLAMRNGFQVQVRSFERVSANPGARDGNVRVPSIREQSGNE